jgi:tRNA dimethylallyltransferase
MAPISSAPPPARLHTESEIALELGRFLQSRKNPLVVITGPTASGKTALSLRLSKTFDGEVVNADSRQFFRGMDIGTAKITPAETQEVPHHLLSFLEPHQHCTTAQFKDLAEAAISSILARGKVPFLVGGSGLFIDAVCHDLDIPRVAPQPELRARLDLLSSAELAKQLEAADPLAAAAIHPHNRPRLIRALEVISMGDRLRHAFREPRPSPWQIFKIAVWSDPERLKTAIADRTAAIWQNGFLDEVTRLLAQGYDENTPALNAHGYREAIRVLKGDLTEAEAMAQMTRNTQKYAKRQRTWWRRDLEVRWVKSAE